MPLAEPEVPALPLVDDGEVLAVVELVSLEPVEAVLPVEPVLPEL